MTDKKKKKPDEGKRDRGRPPVDKKEPPERYSLDVNFDLEDDLIGDGEDDLLQAQPGDDILDGGISEEDAGEAGHQIQIWKKTKYTAQVKKGSVGDVEILIWDKVRDCRANECPIFKSCPYVDTELKRKKAIKLQEDGVRIGRCGVEMKYIHYIEQPFLALMQKSPDSFIMQTIGMHLIPLYHDLIQLKIEKAGLKEITYKDSKGTLRMHPVFDQLEKVHKAILTVWRSSRLMQFAMDVGFFKAGGSMLPKDDLDEYGAMAYGIRDAVPVGGSSGGAVDGFVNVGVTKAVKVVKKRKRVKAKKTVKKVVDIPSPKAVDPVEAVDVEIDEFDGI